MSNYTILLHKGLHSEAVDRWVGRHAGASEVHTEMLNDQRLVIIGREVRRSIRPGVMFKGTLVASEREVLLFGVNGWLSAPDELREYPGDYAGEYMCAQWGREGLRVDRDVFGSARLLHTSGEGYVAVSDSLLVLASLRRALGGSVTANPEALVARTVKNNFAGQQISPETIVDEIAYVPAGRGLMAAHGGTSWELTGARMADRILNADLDYVETVRRSAIDVARVVASLAAVEAWTPVLSLSGGYDSRAIFAAIVAAGVAKRFRAHTNDLGKRAPGDYEAATHLRRMFGVSSPIPDSPGESDAGDALAHWGGTLLGIYDGYGPRRLTRRYARRFTVTGIGAEIHKGNWGWKPLKALTHSVTAGPGAARDALLAQGTKGLLSVGGDPEIPDASELLYLGYRNGIHGASGHIGIHMTGVHPLMQLRSAQLGHMGARGAVRNASSTFVGSPIGIADHTILLSPEVAVQPYDKPDRNLAKEYVTDRLTALGGAIGKVAPYRIYGHPDDVPDGASQLSLSISRELGLTGAITADAVLSRAEVALDLLQDAHVRAAYEDVLANAKWRISRYYGDIVAAGIAPPRLTMLEIFRLAA